MPTGQCKNFVDEKFFSINFALMERPEVRAWMIQALLLLAVWFRKV